MSTPTTGTAFAVDLQQLEDAIQTVTNMSESIQSEITVMQSRFQTIASLWKTPTTSSYEEVETWFNSAATQLSDLLELIVSKLQQAYDTYVTTEKTNVGNAGG
jgi:WXG100 family type VII secretion target